jgi:hypothetical protein
VPNRVSSLVALLMKPDPDKRLTDPVEAERRFRALLEEEEDPSSDLVGDI